jgi:hypothetical protein
MTNEELKRYREYLKFLVRNNRPDIFTNGNTDHAATVLTEMFNNAGVSAIMLCHKLSDDIFTEEYKEAFKNFISQTDHNTRILVKSDADCDQGFFSDLLKRTENVEIRVASKKAIKDISGTIGFNDCDFAVFDGKMFRLEYNAQQRKSIGSFNDPQIASNLTQQFDKHFIGATLCQIPAAS